jgi:hypothetical protein
MERLSGLDASFLYAETPETPRILHRCGFSDRRPKARAPSKASATIDKLADYIVDEFAELKRAVERRRSKAEAPREKSRTKREQRAPAAT